MSDPEKKDRRVRIEVPESYKPIDEEVWEELESYIYQGFLSGSAHILGKTFVFKSLNHQELKYIQYMKPMRLAPPDVSDTFKINFIAHSIFLIQGENMLVERHKKISRLIRIISKVDRDIQNKIMENLSVLNNRAYRLHPLSEIYVHENRSRFRWMHSNISPVHATLNTGIPGTDELGMNYCQQAWTALNRLTDIKELMERDWTNAKFIGSCFAGKGVRSIDEKDKTRRERERSEFEEKKMKVLFNYLNRSSSSAEKPEEIVKLSDGRNATVSKRHKAQTAEELADQLSAALSGEKDFHDLVVENQINKIRLRAGQMELERQKIWKAPLPEIPNNGSSSRVLGGKGEAEELLNRIRDAKFDQIQRYHTQVPEDLENSDKNS